MFKKMLLLALAAAQLIPQRAWAIPGGAAAFEELLFSDIPPVSLASARAESIDDAPANAFSITGDEMRARGYRTLFDLFDALPGSSYDYRRGINHAIKVHGLDSRNNFKVLVNGVTMNDRASDEPAVMGAFPVDIIDHVELITGAYAPLYGRDCVAGVINVVTKKDKKPELGAVVGDGNLKSAAFQNGHKIGGLELNYSLWAEQMLRDLKKDYPEIYSDENVTKWDSFDNTFNTGSTPPFDPFNPLDGRSTAVFDFSDTYNANLSAKWGDWSYDFDFNQENRSAFSTIYPEFAYISRKDMNAFNRLYGGKLGHEFSPTEKLKIASNLNYQYYEHTQKNVYRDRQSGHRYYGRRTKAMGAGTIATYEVTPQNTLLAWLNYETTDYYRYKDSGTISPTAPKVSWADNEIIGSTFLSLSLQDEARLGEKNKLVAGVFVERANSRSPGTIALPRLAYVFAPGSAHVLKVMYGSGLKAVPGTARFDILIVGTPASSRKGSNSLKPSKMTTHELQYVYRPSVSMRVTANGFYNLLDDPILLVANPGDPVFGRAYKNVDATQKFWGGDLMMDAQVTSKVKMNAQYSYVREKDTGPGMAIAGLSTPAEQEFPPMATPGQMAKLGAHVQLWGGKIDLFAWEAYKFDFQDHSTAAVRQRYEVLYGDPKNIVVYHTDLAVNTTPAFNPRLTFSLSVTNLFNDRGYMPRLAPSVADQTFYLPRPNLARTISLSTRYRW